METAQSAAKDEKRAECPHCRAYADKNGILDHFYIVINRHRLPVLKVLYSMFVMV